MRRHLRWGALLLALALVAAACASDDDSDGDAGVEVEDNDRGITDDEIRIAGLANMTGGGLSPFGAGSDVGAQARFQRANDAGGIHGREIVYVDTFDDGSDPSKNRDAVQQILDDDIFAVAPTMTATFAGSADLRDNSVPYFGWGVSPEFCSEDTDNTFAFGFTGCIPASAGDTATTGEVYAKFLDGAEGKSVAIVGQDDDAGRQGVQLLKEQFEYAGFDVPYAEAVTPAAASGRTLAPQEAAPVVQDLMTADNGVPTDLVILVNQFADTVTVIGGLGAAGFTGVTGNALTYDPRILAIPQTSQALEGATVFLQFEPYEAADTVPAVEQMIEDIEAIDPEQALTQPVAAGYWSADLLVGILEETGEDLTVESFMDASDGYTHDGQDATGDSEWPLNHDLSVPCLAIVQVEGGQYVSAQPLECTDFLDGADTDDDEEG